MYVYIYIYKLRVSRELFPLHYTEFGGERKRDIIISSISSSSSSSTDIIIIISLWGFQAQTVSCRARRASPDRQLARARLARAEKAVATLRWYAPSRHMQEISVTNSRKVSHPLLAKNPYPS